MSETLLLLGARRDTRLFKAIVGTFYAVRWNPNGVVNSAIPQTIGTVGQADINGLVSIRVGQRRVGVRLEIEIKSGQASQTDQQKSWQRMVESLGGIYILARSAEDAAKQLELKIAEFAA